MEQLISEENRRFLRERFAGALSEKVVLELYTLGSFLSEEAPTAESDELESTPQEATRLVAQMLTELAEVSEGYLEFSLQDLETPEGETSATEAGIEASMLPAIAFKAGSMQGKSIYYGLPSGYEFGTMVDNFISLSSGDPELAPKTVEKLQSITNPVSMLVFVTPT
jgi:hypothetical protein